MQLFTCKLKTMKASTTRWNTLILLALVLFISACEKSETAGTDKGKGYYVTMTVNGERIEYKGHVRISLSDPPDEEFNYQLFNLEGSNGVETFRGEKELFMQGSVYEEVQLGKTYENVFEIDEITGEGGEQNSITLQYVNKELSVNYQYIRNDVFKTGSVKVVFKKITSKDIRGTFEGVLDVGIPPYTVSDGKITDYNPPLVVKGEFYAPLR